uniref:Amine oxidase n=1 Tax=Gongylonema pulchrum TaxID=637853 RepID=A0A183E143_9BILA
LPQCFDRCANSSTVPTPTASANIIGSGETRSIFGTSVPDPDSNSAAKPTTSAAVIESGEERSAPGTPVSQSVDYHADSSSAETPEVSAVAFTDSQERRTSVTPVEQTVDRRYPASGTSCYYQLTTATPALRQTAQSSSSPVRSIARVTSQPAPPALPKKRNFNRKSVEYSAPIKLNHCASYTVIQTTVAQAIAVLSPGQSPEVTGIAPALLAITDATALHYAVPIDYRNAGFRNLQIFDEIAVLEYFAVRIAGNELPFQAISPDFHMEHGFDRRGVVLIDESGNELFSNYLFQQNVRWQRP